MVSSSGTGKFMNSRPALAENTFALKAELHLNARVSYFLMLCIYISNTLKGVKLQNKSVISFQKELWPGVS